MSSTIKVYVIKAKGRRNLVLRAYLPNGTTRDKSSGTRIARDAERAAAKWEAELLQSAKSAGLGCTWEEFREEFTSQYLPSVRDSTAGKYEQVLTSYESLMRPARLADVTSAKVLSWQNKLRKNGLAEPSIGSCSAHIKAALRWAKKCGLITDVPEIKMPPSDPDSPMKGRPLTQAEFAKMLRSVRMVIKNREQAKEYRQLMRSMYWGGLRLGEALKITWDRSGFFVDLKSGKHPQFAISAKSEKGKKSRLLPIAPEYANQLLARPGKSGRVHPIRTIRDRDPQVSNVSKIIADIGRAAAIETQEGSHATAHDLRRSFGTRWATRVKPAVLMKLMRHSSISTTMRYYVQIDADDLAEILYKSL